MSGLIAVLVLLVLGNLLVFLVLPAIMRRRRPRGSPETRDERVTRLLSAMVPVERQLERAHRKVPKDAVAEGERRQLFAGFGAALDELCSFYLEGDAGLRGEIRAFFDGRQPLRIAMLEHAYAAAREIDAERRGEENVAALRRALAAISIEDNRLDYRDTFGVLGELYLRSAKAGIGPRQALGEVAALSSETAPEPGDRPMSVFLREFEKSAYFEQSVAPRLGEA